MVHIPSNPEYSSLNVAAAVQILSYECRVAQLDILKEHDADTTDTVSVPKVEVKLPDGSSLDEEIVSAKDMEGYLFSIRKAND